MTKDEALAYGDTDEGLTSIEETCDALDALKSYVRQLDEHPVQIPFSESDFESAFRLGYRMGLSRGSNDETEDDVVRLWRHQRICWAGTKKGVQP